jgi:DNA-binding NarL/FixJ family response regulator
MHESLLVASAQRVSGWRVVARRFVVGIAYASPDVVAVVRSAVGRDLELRDAQRLPHEPSGDIDLLLVGTRTEWRITDQLLSAGYSVVFLTDTRDEREEYEAVERGAVGYLVVSASVETVRRSIWAALSGEPIFRRSVLGRWLRAQNRETRDDMPGYLRLTTRQQQILAMIAAGATTKEIAATLRIERSTVDKHVSNLLRRMGAPNRAGAVGRLRGLRNGGDQDRGAA